MTAIKQAAKHYVLFSNFAMLCLTTKN